MKKHKLQDKFFAELAKIPIVQVACEKTGISRNSIYKWRRTDKEFAKKMDESLAEGVAFINDMSEIQMLTMIKEKNWPVISFWLRHRNDNYRDKIEVTTKKQNEELTLSQIKIVKHALELASIIKTESINKINGEKSNDQNN